MYSQLDTVRSVPFVCSEAAEESYQKCIRKNNKILVYRSKASCTIVFKEITNEHSHHVKPWLTMEKNTP